MYIESGLTHPMIVNCCNRKFGLSLPYHAYGKVIQDVRQELHGYIDFTQTQTLQLLQMLEQMKKDDPNTKFAYLFDSTLGEQERLDPTNPQIEVLIVQTPMMSKNY